MSLITPDSGLIIWMTLIFAIVFFILAKFGFPVISKMIKDRSTKIEDSLRKADEAEKRLSELTEEHRRMIEDTRREQAEILKEAAQARDNIIEQARRQAQDEAAKLVDEARVRIENEKEAALRDIRREVAILSVNVAEKIIRKDLESTDAQTQLLNRLVDEAADAEINS